jgi:hypothetical protein
MTHLENYLQDGANYQARATLMYLQALCNIKESWNKTTLSYDAEVKVARWENCREQGYVVSLTNPTREQLNIAFFEHRNSDEISAVKWEQKSINSLTIDTAKFGDIYKTKYDTSHEVPFGEASKMAGWIFTELTTHWVKGNQILIDRYLKS